MTEFDKEHLLELVADLATAWLSNKNNAITAEALPGLLQSLHSSVKALRDAGDGAAGSEPAEEHVPAVSVRKSLASKDHILSLIDGKPYRTLKKHLASHGLTPEEYRARYKLPAAYPMVAPGYAALRSEMAKKLGLGRKPAPKARAARTAASKGRTAAKAPAQRSAKAVAKPRTPRTKKQDA